MNIRAVARIALCFSAAMVLAGCTTLQGIPAGPSRAIALGDKFHPSGSMEVVLHAFLGGRDGTDPYDDGLLSDSRGDLFGTTHAGGSFNDQCVSHSGCGGVFEMVLSGNTYVEKTLHSFLGPPDGATPFGGNLIADSTGAIYGVTIGGGSYNMGAVFKLTPRGGGYSESIIHSFSGAPDGSYPQAGLLRDANGNLYGTTSIGGSYDEGTVYELLPSNGVYEEKVLYTFGSSGSNDGEFPGGSLIFDGSGALYGTTSGGGGGPCGVGCGTVYKLVPSHGAYNEQIIHTFQFTDGADPLNGALTAAGPGVFYGTTAEGGSGSNCNVGCGTVFELAGSGSSYTFTVLHDFDKGSGDGALPQGTLVLRHRYLYGTTLYGGNHGGIVFRLSLTGSEKILHTFNGIDGRNPVGGVLMNSRGIFGTTYRGGNPDCGFCGVVFEIPAST